jgi:hypothetical protein
MLAVLLRAVVCAMLVILALTAARVLNVLMANINLSLAVQLATTAQLTPIQMLAVLRRAVVCAMLDILALTAARV